jgi:transposase
MHQQAWERAMKRQEIILRAMSGKINWTQAADILGVSARQMRRLKYRYEKLGAKYLVDQRFGKPSWNRIEGDIVKKVMALYREKYFDFNVKHFHEKLENEHNIYQSYTWVKNILHDSGLVRKTSKREKHRKKRERRPMVGMMLHLDGSEHHWLGEDKPKWDLLVVLDDANNEIYAAEFVPEEDTRSVLRILHSVVDKKGIFCSLYTDRATHFIYTPKAGEKPDPSIRTHCQRALDHLGIRLITAMSPQARGRSERIFRTIQGRLPQELRLARICTLEQANQYLKEIFIQNLNKQFKVESKEKTSAFLEIPYRMDLDKIFCLRYERVVNNDNTIQFKNKTFQIPQSHLRYHFVKCKVTLFEHLDGTLSIGYGPHTLAKYSLNGQLLDNSQQPFMNFGTVNNFTEERTCSVL